MTSLARSSAVMATGTVVSRVTGVARDIAAAAALGFYIVADAFSLGNSLPNIIYILVVGGALNAVFVPQLVRRMKEDDDDGRAYADRLLTLVGTILLVLAVLAVALAPLIVDLYTPADYPPQAFDLAVAFARLCLPQILFYGIYTMLSQVLNARGQFGAPMFAPIANNIIAIATFTLFIVVAGTSAAADGVLTTEQVLILGIGTTLGVVIQALILIPVLMRAGHVWRPRFDWRDAGLGKAAMLAGWTIGLVLVNQLTYLVITRLATQANVNAAAAGTTAAGLTTYQKAHLVFMLPHSVITISIVTALLPTLSRMAHDGRLRELGSDVGSAMRFVAALILPVAAILVVLGSSIAVLLFGYGAATPEQASVMGTVVSLFMLGLLPFTLFYVLLRGFYALEDTRTPFVITIAFSLAWLAMAVPLFTLVGRDNGGAPQIAMLALTYSLSYWIGLAITWIVLARRTGGLDSGRTVWAIIRMVIAAVIAIAVMALALGLVSQYVTGTSLRPASADKLAVLVNIVIVSAVGLLAYLAAAWALRIGEVQQGIALIRRKARAGARSTDDAA